MRKSQIFDFLRELFHLRADITVVNWSGTDCAVQGHEWGVGGVIGGGLLIGAVDDGSDGGRFSTAVSEEEEGGEPKGEDEEGGEDADAGF